MVANGANTAQIGIQNHTGNDWFNLGSSTESAGKYENATGQDLINNAFNVNSGDAAIGHVTPTNWFVTNAGTDLACQNPCTPNQIPLIGIGNEVQLEASNLTGDRSIELLDGLYHQVATGQDVLSNFAPAYSWMIKRDVFRTIQSAYEVDVPSEYQWFMEQEATSSVGQFQSFDYELGRLGLPDAAMAEQLAGVESQIQGIMDAGKPALEEFNSLPSNEQITQVQSGAVGEIMPGLAEAWQKRSDIYAELQAQTEAAANNLSSENNALPVTTEFEKYEQQINGIYLNTLAVGNQTLNESDAATVELIAGLCPFEGGFAVYKARAIYHTVFKTYKPEWFECKEEVRPRDVESLKLDGATEIDFALVPNPTAGKCQIQLNKDLADGGTVSVFNATGRLLLSREFNGNLLEIETSDFNEGVLFVKVADGFGNSTVKKLMIIR